MKNWNPKIYSGIMFLVVAISLPVTIFLVNRPQTLEQQAAQKVPEPTIADAGCPIKNPDGTKNICRPEPYCLTGEKMKFNGNEECSQLLGKEGSCCTSEK
jgi:hypothetical protein